MKGSDLHVLKHLHCVTDLLIKIARMNCAICKHFFSWILFSLKDYIILDEGHKIKNTATKTSKNLRAIPAKYHFILTGTPVQNNLRVSLTV